MSDQVLVGITVLETTQGVAGPYCAKMLRAHGARVIKVEPPGGDLCRTLLPKSEAGESGLFAWLNAGKESIQLDRNDPEDQAIFLKLCQLADVLIHEGEDSPAPGTLIDCDISWFGHQGPYSGYRGSDAVVSALAGMVYGVGLPEGPPIIPTGYQPSILAGVTAAIGVMAALVGRLATGRSRQISLSILDASLVLVEVGAIAPSYGRPVNRMRFGVNRFPPTFPMGIYQCSDGWVGITALTPSQWQAFCELLDEPELAANPKYYNTLNRLADANLIEDRFAPKLKHWSAREFVEQGQARRIPLAMVPTAAEMLELDEFTSRGVFPQISTPAGESFRGPELPFRLTRTPGDSSGIAPSANQHSDSLKAELNVAFDEDNNEATNDVEKVRSPGLPLEGVRIVDLSMGWSGPLAARYCADLGAEVIKVEACQYPDWWRGWEATREWIDNREYEKAPTFNAMNRNKKGITLDLTRPEGVRLLKKMVRDADALIENNTSTVMPKLGLSYEDLLPHNPALVMLSMPAYGMGNRWSHFRAYGSTVEQASGLPHLNGYDNWPPTLQHVALGDAVAGINAAVALLMAIFHKHRTGEGQFVDFSQVESVLNLAAHGVIEQSLNNRPWPRLGDRHPEYRIHGVYQCQGEDQWLVIVAASDAEIAAIKKLTGSQNLDETLAKWCLARSPEDAMASLQSADIAAGLVRSVGELLDDPHIAATGMFVPGPTPHQGEVMYPHSAFKIEGSRLGVRNPAPLLGQHNNEVLQGLLGLTDEEFNELEQAQIVGDLPLLQVPG